MSEKNKGMKGRNITCFLWLFPAVLFLCLFIDARGVRQESREQKVQEFWMGVYVNDMKVGFSHSKKWEFSKGNKRFKMYLNEARMNISRFGGKPVEMVTIQETLYDINGDPLESLFRMKMSDNETVVKAVMERGRIVFRSGDLILKELVTKEKFYLDVPVEKVVEKQGLEPGAKYSFKILDFTSFSLVNVRLEVLGEEDVLILGKKMRLWHLKEEVDYIVPVVIEEWVDIEGRSWKTVNRTGFLTTTFIQMEKDRAEEVSDKNFDIAFSSFIPSNLRLENPLEIQAMKVKISGIPPEKIESFFIEDETQKILEKGEDYVLVQVSSLIFKEKDAIDFPVKAEEYREFLRPTLFCQSNSQEIRNVAGAITGKEGNAWKAAKKIASWVRMKMTSSYDIGFASATEVLKNLEGDCSEYTVLAVSLYRAAGIPARAAVGIMYSDGMFGYHMWPEVYVGSWVGLDSLWLAEDKKVGEFYTDATHIKFGQTLLDEDLFREMVRAISEVMRRIKVEIVDYHYSSPGQSKELSTVKRLDEITVSQGR